MEPEGSLPQSEVKIIKQLTSNTSYFTVCEATCFGPYVTIIRPSYESSQAVRSVRHLSLSWASSIHSITPHPAFWRSILILSSHLHLGLPSRLFSSDFSTKTLYTRLLSPICATCPAHLILLDFVTCLVLENGNELNNRSCWHVCLRLLFDPKHGGLPPPPHTHTHTSVTKLILWWLRNVVKFFYFPLQHVRM